MNLQDGYYDVRGAGFFIPRVESRERAPMRRARFTRSRPVPARREAQEQPTTLTHQAIEQSALTVLSEGPVAQVEVEAVSVATEFPSTSCTGIVRVSQDGPEAPPVGSSVGHR